MPEAPEVQSAQLGRWVLSIQRPRLVLPVPEARGLLLDPWDLLGQFHPRGPAGRERYCQLPLGLWAPWGLSDLLVL